MGTFADLTAEKGTLLLEEQFKVGRELRGIKGDQPTVE
jgi:hypothetical protein